MSAAKARSFDKTELFAHMPVRQAVLRQILPAIASQMITLLYNLADTYFVGQLNDPFQTAAVTVATAAFVMLTAISNLFGIGGAGAIASALGKRQPDKAKQIADWRTFQCVSCDPSSFRSCSAEPQQPLPALLPFCSGLLPGPPQRH